MITRQVKAQLDEAKRARHELDIVTILTEIIKSNRNVNKAFADVVDELRKAVNIDWAGIILIRDKGVYFYALSSRISSAWKVGDVVSIKGVTAAWLHANKRAFVEPDPARKRKFLTDKYYREQGLRSILFLPLLDNGKVFGALIIASTRYNTYQKKELAFLEHISDQLANVIRITQLYTLERERSMKLEAEEKERLQFLNALAHELKTPLTAIVASAGLLIEEIDEEVKSPRVRLTQNIIHAIQKLEARLSELMDMARIGSRGFELNLELLDIRPLLQDVVYEQLPVAVEKKQSVTLDTPSAIPMVWVDKQRLEQILVNLVNNAIKFTWEGDNIYIRLRKQRSELVVEVEDHGPGITKEEQERIFQPYYRIEADRQRFSGLGLGLALSKQLVGLHGGKMWVRSKHRTGSIFSFSIPIKKPK